MGGHHACVGHGHAVLLREPEVFQKHLFQLRQEGERAAAEEDGGLHIDAPGECAQDLQADRVEHRQRDVGLADVAGQQVLDVGLGKYAATGRDGIDMFGFFG